MTVQNAVARGREAGGRYFGGLDYVKIIFAMAIVAWHVKLFGPGTVMGPAATLNIGITDVLNCNVLLAGVPIFFLVSLFLYINNRTNKKNYFSKRIKHLTFLYTFWTLAAMVLMRQGIRLEYFYPSLFIISGAGTHVYFLFSLLVLTLVTEGMLQLKKRVDAGTFYAANNALLIAAAATLVFRTTLAGLPILSGYNDLILSFLSPVNYLAYPFLAIALDRYYREGRLKAGPGILALAGAVCLAAALEWTLMPSDANLAVNGLLMPPYARASMALSSVLVVALFLSREFNPPAIIKTLSSLTLGVYLIHIFLQRFLYVIFPEFSTLTGLAGNQFFFFAVVLGISAVLAYCVKKVGIV